jgi:hypothetical protein
VGLLPACGGLIVYWWRVGLEPAVQSPGAPPLKAGVNDGMWTAAVQ